MTTSRDDRPASLRERKKAKTRTAIQAHALRLFIDQGYTATTVEQIADAAEVSPSTFYRYFPTKEEAVLYDRLDPILIDGFLRQPDELSPIAAIRGAIAEVFQRLSSDEYELEQERARLIFSVPELRAALLDQLVAGLSMLNEAVAQRIGRKPDDLNIRIWSGAVVGVAVASFLASMQAGHDYVAQMDRALALLEAGLPMPG